jgi:hypothetical protein
MSATVAFTDLGSLAGAGFPNISDLADEQLHLETEISSEHCSLSPETSCLGMRQSTGIALA